MKALSVLGSTGSIGTQTLELVEEFPDRFRVVALTAGNNLDLLIEQIRRHAPEAVALADAGRHGFVRDPAAAYTPGGEPDRREGQDEGGKTRQEAASISRQDGQQVPPCMPDQDTGDHQHARPRPCDGKTGQRKDHKQQAAKAAKLAHDAWKRRETLAPLLLVPLVLVAVLAVVKPF